MTRGLHWSEEELAAYNARKLGAPAPLPITPFIHEERRNSPYWPYRSKTEWRYAELLAQQLSQGFIDYWSYEPIRLRLAPATTLTVDFMVQAYAANDPRIQFREVKGAWIREDSWQKLKIAAVLYPMFRFVRVQWKNNRWHYLEVPSA